MTKINRALRRARKAVAAGVAALAGELVVLAIAGGPWDEQTIGAAVGLAVAAGIAAYRTRNKLGVNELTDQLGEAKRESRL